MKKQKIALLVLVFTLSLCLFAPAALADSAEEATSAQVPPGPAPEETVSYETGFYTVDETLCYYSNGELLENAEGAGVLAEDTEFAKAGTTIYVKNGVFQENAAGIVSQIDSDMQVYVENGIRSDKTGLAKHLDSGKWLYVRNGSFDNSMTGLVAKIHDDQKQYYVNKGAFQKTTGLIKRASDKNWVYIKKGVFTKTTGLVKRPSDKKWVYIKNGVFTKTTGLVKRPSDKKWVYVRKGVFTKSTGLIKRSSDKKWVYIQKGVFTKATGLAKRLTDGKWMYVKKGLFTKATGVAKKLTNKKWYYVKGGYAEKYTGLAKRLTDKKWVYVIKGVPSNDVSKFVLSAADEKAGRKEAFVQAYARAVAETITTKSMSESQKIRVCFDYVISHYASTNNPRIPHYNGDGWTYIYAYDMFGPRGGGNCMSYGAAFAYIAKAAGCKEVYAINNGAHGWTEINGLVYDPEQYHDTNTRKIYAKHYNDPMLPGYWSSVSGANSKRVRVLIKAF